MTRRDVVAKIIRIIYKIGFSYVRVILYDVF